MARAAVCAAIAAMALAMSVSGIACPPGVTQPSVTTLVASTAHSETDAWIVKPDCVYETELLKSGGALSVSQVKDLDRIEGIPTDTELVSITARLSRGADFSRATKLKLIWLIDFESGLIDNLKLPSTLKALVLKTALVDSVDKLNLPESMTGLTLDSMTVSSLTSLPSSLTELELVSTSFSEINFPIPPKLQRLTMNRNPLLKLGRVTFPDSLTNFGCTACGIARVRGVKWSRELTSLALENNPIREFEVRQSDVDVLSKLAKIDFNPSQTTCSDKEATVTDIQGRIFCVISDDRFEMLYGGDGKTSSSASRDKDTNSPSASGEDSNSAASRGTDENNTNSTSSRMGASGNKAVGSNGQNPSDGNGGGTKETIVVNTPSSPISSTVIGILIAVSSVFGILFVLISYRYYRSSRRTREKEATATLMLYDTPKATKNEDPASSHGEGSSQEYLSNDIRNDKTIIPYRIDEKRISLSKQIARGGFGVIFRGVYSGRAVAVKQMLPDAWRNETQLIDFMDEIRLCASLSHPKIVEFIGVAWTSLRDISVVIEFMDGGDLHALLQKHARDRSLSSSTTSLPPSESTASSSSSFTPLTPSPREWFDHWTTASINCKTSIARDIAEAVVYLHSFSNPIVHRDLKARNVLLDSHGNAKLSDFGISREMAVDETMTSEVGTSAWIAPEVLRGDRYSERADIYSFGVLLVELDKCRHPYAGEESLGLMGCGPIGLVGKQHDARDSQSQAMHQNMQIAMLVSAGRLRPKPSAPCPDRIQALISRCLSFAPEDRPSAMEAHYELRQILAGR